MAKDAESGKRAVSDLIVTERNINVTAEQFSKILARACVPSELKAYMQERFDIKAGERYMLKVFYEE